DPAQEGLPDTRGVEDAAVALDERLSPPFDPERRREVGAVEELELDAAPGKRRGALLRPGAEVERAGRPEELLARLGLQLAPERERALCLRDPVRVVVDEPEDPPPAVARPARVAELELLQDDRLVTGTRERVCRRGAHDAGADDDDLG